MRCEARRAGREGNMERLLRSKERLNIERWDSS